MTMKKVTRAKLKRSETLKKQKELEKAGDNMVRNIYKEKAYFAGPTYLSVIDNGDNNIAIRLTFAEPMLLNNNKVEHNIVSAVVMNISDFIKLYNLSTLQLQKLREAKRVP